MVGNFNLHNTLEKLVEKLSNWGDSLILKLPNLVLAILTFVAFWFAAKHISKFIKKVLLKKLDKSL